MSLGQISFANGKITFIFITNTWNIFQEYFQGLESHMILTETLFRKISSYTSPRETQQHSDLMARASAVLKQAHKRGVELEYILEVRLKPFLHE